MNEHHVQVERKPYLPRSSLADTGKTRVPGESEVIALIHETVDRILPTHRTITVLEAGGGSDTMLRLRRSTHVVVMDINPAQLERNHYANEKIVGNLEIDAIPRRKFDLVVCWNVLEHLTRPTAALRNMAEHLADDGLLLIGCPDLYSAKGVVTKLTPHWLHVWYYRTICGHAHAGEFGHAPFVTYLHRETSLSAVSRWARHLGLETVLIAGYRGPAVDSLRRKSALGYAVYRSFALAMQIGSLGLVEPDSSDYVILLRKRAAESTTKHNVDRDDCATLRVG